jgi:hypothetical protein
MMHQLINSPHSPNNVASLAQNGDWYLIDNTNLSVIGGASVTLMTFGYNAQIWVGQGGTDSLYLEGHKEQVTVAEATNPTLVNVFGAWLDNSARFEITTPSSTIANPVLSPDGHGGTLATAGNVTLDFRDTPSVDPAQIVRHA